MVLDEDAIGCGAWRASFQQVGVRRRQNYRSLPAFLQPLLPLGGEFYRIYYECPSPGIDWRFGHCSISGLSPSRPLPYLQGHFSLGWMLLLLLLLLNSELISYK